MHVLSAGASWQSALKQGKGDACLRLYDCSQGIALNNDHARVYWRRQREAKLLAGTIDDADIVRAVGMHFPILQRDRELDELVSHMGLIQSWDKDPQGATSAQ